MVSNTNFFSTPDLIVEFIAKMVIERTCFKRTISMTHDVDYTSCYNFLSKLAEYEHSQGVSATFYFLTRAGYKVEKTLLRNLKDMGHEIGVHGNFYDLRLAYRNTNTITKNLEYAKKYLEDLLGEKILGFRNHSVILSPNLLEAVKNVGFAYDSSIYSKSIPNILSRWFCWPFKYANSQLWEIPASWPIDTDTFRKYKLSEKDAMKLYLLNLDTADKINGFSCFSFHPSIIENHYSFYKNLILKINERGYTYKTLINMTHELEKEES